MYCGKYDTHNTEKDISQRQICMVVTAEENTMKDWLETRVLYRHCIASITRPSGHLLAPQWSPESARVNAKPINSMYARIIADIVYQSTCFPLPPHPLPHSRTRSYTQVRNLGCSTARRSTPLRTNTTLAQVKCTNSGSSSRDVEEV